MRAFVIDAFTDVAFRGNPAGVVLLTKPERSSWMQDVAAEMRHSETAFVSARGDGAYDLRWFTPAAEVDLCGHATLATTHALASLGGGGPYVFLTRSGPLRTNVAGDGVIEMEFPAQPVTPVAAPPRLVEALGVTPVAVLSNGIDLLVEVADASVVAGLAPDIAALHDVECRGAIVTAAAPADADHDFVSRFFAPRLGVDEDPVTGSAHCALAPYWSQRSGRSAMTGVQLSPRGGRVVVEVQGDKVVLRGRAVTVLEGTLRA